MYRIESAKSGRGKCHHKKCELSIDKDTLRLGKQYKMRGSSGRTAYSWFHLDCATIFKKDIDAPTSLDGHAELSETDRDIVIAWFEGLPRAAERDSASVPAGEAAWTCPSCGRGFGAATTPRVYAMHSSEGCGHCGAVQSHWIDEDAADDDFKRKCTSLSCDRSDCRKSVIKRLERVSETETGEKTDCFECGRRVFIGYQIKEVPAASKPRRRKLMEILGVGSDVQ